MALVSGQPPPVSPFAELAFSDLSSMRPSEDSDDDYVYVSILSEQIAHALMLDDDDDVIPSRSQRSITAAHGMGNVTGERFSQVNQCQQDCKWPSSRPSVDSRNFVVQTTDAMMHPVSQFDAAWREHGPSEWDCFNTPSRHQASKQLSALYATQLEHSFCRHFHLFQGRNPAYNNQVAACPGETWYLRPQEFPKTLNITASSARKESTGTGVFLPNIVNSGSQYRRKSGFSSPKSVHPPRHKC